MDTYEFTNKWFEPAKPIWSKILTQSKPNKILEIGSYEGASTCYLIEKLSLFHDSLEIHSIDTWNGGVEHKNIDMKLVEDRFKKNTSLAKKNLKRKLS